MPPRLRRVVLGLLAGVGFASATHGLWRMVLTPVHGWPLLRLMVGALLGFGVARFFLARSALLSDFLMRFPTDPRPGGRTSLGLYLAAGGVLVLSAALVLG